MHVIIAKSRMFVYGACILIIVTIETGLVLNIPLSATHGILYMDVMWKIACLSPFLTKRSVKSR